MTAPKAARIASPETGLPADPRVEALVNDVIGRVADKWTMLILEALTEHGEQRFTRLGELVGGVSQKMLTQTLRGLERDGLVTRTVFAQVPPRVDYDLTDPGRSLIAPLAALDAWAREHIDTIEASRTTYDASLAAV